MFLCIFSPSILFSIRIKTKKIFTDESHGGQASAKIAGTIDKVSPPVIVNIILAGRALKHIKKRGVVLVPGQS